MKYILSASLILLLVIQIYSIDPHFTFPEHFSGTIEKLEKTTKKFFSRTLLTAELSAVRTQSHDSLIFVGDVLLARNVEHLMNKNGGSYPFDGIDLEAFSSKPAIIGNFEAAVPEEHVWTPVGQIDFSVPTSSLPYLNEAGFSHLSLGNNHSYDFEENGFIHTTQSLSKYFEVFGLPNGLSEHSVSFISSGDTVISLIGIHALVAIEDDELRALFRYANKESDLQFVYVHWGEEYALRQNNNQRALAEQFIKHGADLIVGHHPHVVQGIELIEGVPVFYSLGNYIFDQYFSKDVQEGLIVLLDIHSDTGIHLLPVTSKMPMSQPRLMNNKDHASFLNTLATKSDSALSESIKSGFIPFGETVATSTKIAMIDSK